MPRKGDIWTSRPTEDACGVEADWGCFHWPRVSRGHWGAHTDRLAAAEGPAGSDSPSRWGDRRPCHLSPAVVCGVCYDGPQKLGHRWRENRHTHTHTTEKGDASSHPGQALTPRRRRSHPGPALTPRAGPHTRARTDLHVHLSSVCGASGPGRAALCAPGSRRQWGEWGAVLAGPGRAPCRPQHSHPALHP